jgi:chemotaxis family two-component system response regulator Rcp1
MRLLVVEDNVADARLVVEALRVCSVPTQVTVVSDGIQALLYLRSEGQYVDVVPPDVILLDLNLPKKDGREVLREIKSDQALKHIPVIIFTSSEADTEILQAYRNGASCYLVKPLDLVTYFALLQEIVTFLGTRARLPLPVI